MNVAAADQAALAVEARRRVEKALQLIEQAQGLVGDACAVLSTLQYGAPAWRTASKLYDRVHADWYKVERLRSERRIRLDPMAAESFLSRGRPSCSP